MKIKSIYILSLVASFSAFFISCRMDPVGIQNLANFSDTTAIIKSSTTIPFGFALDSALFLNNAKYKAVAIAEANSATLLNQLSHAKIVKADGSLDFTNSDALVIPVASAGLNLYGYSLIGNHDLNAAYLKTYSGITAGLPTSTIQLKLDTAMNKFITQTITHYKDKIHSWAVVSEPLADNGSVGLNSGRSTTSSDVVVWSAYMGKDFALKALNYAHAADPTASLYMEESYLDVYAIKVDSLISYVNYLKGKGAQVDGIGVQLFINISNGTGLNTYANIEIAFRKLGATGLKIRISALSVNENPLAKPFFDPTDVYKLNYQAETYKYIIDSYVKNIPAAQRTGITIWGIDDAHANLLIRADKNTPITSISPLLFNGNFAKKPAFSAVFLSTNGK